eukprot:3099232-Pleurochrysis_carterae.AAC.1
MSTNKVTELSNSQVSDGKQRQSQLTLRLSRARVTQGTQQVLREAAVSLVTFSWPYLAAAMSAVSPSARAAFTFAELSRRIRAQTSFPSRQV